MSNSSLVNYTKLSPNYTKMTNKINRKITISTSNPSGGKDGDIWFKYT